MQEVSRYHITALFFTENIISSRNLPLIHIFSIKFALPKLAHLLLEVSLRPFVGPLPLPRS